MPRALAASNWLWAATSSFWIALGVAGAIWLWTDRAVLLDLQRADEKQQQVQRG